MKYSKVKGYKYKLREVEHIRIPGVPVSAANEYISLDNELLTIKYGYLWDGSSVPFKKRFRWIWDADRYCKTASLVHDAFCQLFREGLLDKKYKEYIDGFYKYMCMEAGMSKWQADLRYWFLRKYGDRYIEKSDPRCKIFET